MRSIKGFLLCTLLLWPTTSFAWCKVYTVKKGDTYASISQHYFKDTYYKLYLERQNKSRVLTAGDKLPFFIAESKADWYVGCQNLIVSRLTQKKAHASLASFLEGIPAGLAGAAYLSGQDNIDPILALDLCIIALAVAETATNYGLTPAVKTKVSVYGFSLDKAFDVLRQYKLLEDMKKEKISVPESMRNVGDATVIFIVHFVSLFAEHKTLIRAFIKYFDESGISETSSKAFITYLEILKIKPYPCKLEDGKDD